MELIDPSPEFSDSFEEALREFDADGIKGFWNAREPIANIVEYIDRVKQQSQGKDIPEGWVPASTFWLVDDGVFVAHVNIRHQLNEYLQKIGGHIGYAVRPSKQGMGYGSAILEYALPKAQELGIARALLTCDPTNIASRKIIEKHGGQLHQEIDVDGRKVLQFWIDNR